MSKAKTCVITCMDFRFQNKVNEFLNAKLLAGHSDLISIAGGTRDFIIPIKSTDKKYVWHQVELSMKLHNPDEVIFIDHQDCGGYAQDNTISKGLPEDKDMHYHKKYFKSLAKEFYEKYPEKLLKFIYITLEGEIIEI